MSWRGWTVFVNRASRDRCALCGELEQFELCKEAVTGCAWSNRVQGDVVIFEIESLTDRFLSSASFSANAIDKNAFRICRILRFRVVQHEVQTRLPKLGERDGIRALEGGIRHGTCSAGLG